MISEMLSGGVAVGERCVRRHFRYATCNACVGSCPTQAFSLVEGRPVVDDERCVMCAACLFVCPTEAISGANPEQRHFRRDQLVAPFSVIAPTVEELLFWHVEHAIRAVAMDPLNHPEWMLAIARLNIRLRQYGQPEWAFVPAAGSDINTSRRAMFHVRREKTDAASVQPGLRRWRHLLPEISDTHPEIDAQKCVLCGACWRACMQKAITFEEGALSVDDSRCTGCGSCVAVCLHQAVSLEYHPHQCATRRMMASGGTCISCQKRFWSLKEDEKVCMLCRHHQYGMRCKA